MTASVSRSFAPGMLLRVVSTSQRGFAAWAASTIARVFVATADIWSNTLRHTFHAACRSPAVPRTRKNASPAVARSPSRRASTTSQPSFPMIRATTFAPASTQSSRVKYSISPGSSPMPSTAHVRSTYGTSSAMNPSMRVSEILSMPPLPSSRLYSSQNRPTRPPCLAVLCAQHRAKMLSPETKRTDVSRETCVPKRRERANHVGACGNDVGNRGKRHGTHVGNA